jgi:hypothetical protein
MQFLARFFYCTPCSEPRGLISRVPLPARFALIDGRGDRIRSDPPPRHALASEPDGQDLRREKRKRLILREHVSTEEHGQVKTTKAADLRVPPFLEGRSYGR